MIKTITCKRCETDFSVDLLPEQAVHINCIPQICNICRGIERICRVCQKHYTRSESRLNAYCSETCRHQFTREKNSAASWIGRHTKVIQCGQCSAFIKAINGVTNCRKCRDAGIVKTCKTCGTEYTTRRNRDLCNACDREVYRRDQKARIDEKLQSSVDAGWDSMRIGAMAELMFDILCIRSGLFVTRSQSDTQPGWDRIVVNGNKAARVQIKGSTVSKDRYSRTGRSIEKDQCELVAVIHVVSGEAVIGVAAPDADSFKKTDDVIRVNAVTGTIEWSELDRIIHTSEVCNG